MSKARIYGMPSKGVHNSKATTPIRGVKSSGVQFTPKRVKPRRKG